MTDAAGLAKLQVRRATTDDAAAIAELHVRGWQWAYRSLIPNEYLSALSDQIPRRVAWWREMLGDRERKWTWVAEMGGRIVGFADTSPSWDDDADPATAMLGAIYLDEAVVRLGVGRALMERAVANLCDQGFASVTLWVLDTNERARRFYEALGWVLDSASKTESRPGFELHEVRYRLAL